MTKEDYKELYEQAFNMQLKLEERYIEQEEKYMKLFDENQKLQRRVSHLQQLIDNLYNDMLNDPYEEDEEL